MSIPGPNGPVSAEDADNFEEIEKQFAVKGTHAPTQQHHHTANS